MTEAYLEVAAGARSAYPRAIIDQVRPSSRAAHHSHRLFLGAAFSKKIPGRDGS